MAVNSFTYNLDEILSTTLLNWRTKGKMYDNILKSNPTFYYMHEKKKKKEKGGERLMIPLRYALNNTVGSYSRYDELDVTPQDNQSAAYYQWKQEAGTIVIDGFSLFQNSGPYQIVDLLQEKISECEDGMAEDINKQIWKITPGTNDLLSIPALIVLAPQTTDAASPGGISSVTYSWWRNQYKQSAASTIKGLTWEMIELYNNCSKGGNRMNKGFPDLGICDQHTFEDYERSLMENVRYVDADFSSKARSAGFQNLAFKNCTLFWDEHIPDAYGDGTTGYDWDNASVTYGSLYFLNTESLQYYVGNDVDLKVGKFLEPVNQDARVAKILHIHQIGCSERRKNGVLHKITKTKTS